MDVIIVSTASPSQCGYWQQRLEYIKGILTDADAIIVVVEEDWKGSAGQALGTLYAYQQARQQIQQRHQLDLVEMQKGGAAVAIFHTVGRGQRLYPLVASESGNKCALKLPSQLLGQSTISVLEAVIAQARTLAPYRKGRLSVFWADQIFLPSQPIKKPTDAAIDIYIKQSGMPSQVQWDAEEWHKYGFIALQADGEVQQLEKSNFHTVQNLLQNGEISAEGGAGISLGSFSLSASMTSALLKEFETELQTKRGFIDCDPGLWMPMTLNRKVYSAAQQKMEHPNSEGHYERMQKFKTQYIKMNPGKPFFRATDVGQYCFWWDYGSVKAYYDRLLTLVGDGPESLAMRQFYQLEKAQLERPKNLEVDEHSLLIDCHIESGTIRNSVLVGVKAATLNIDGGVVINSALNRFEGRQCLLYHAQESAPLSLESGRVRADLFLPESRQHLKLYSDLSRDGKKDWSLKLPGNALTWAELEAIVRP